MPTPKVLRAFQISCRAGLVASLIPALPLAVWLSQSTSPLAGEYDVLGPLLFVALWMVTCAPLGLASAAGLFAEGTTSRIVRRNALREQLTDGEWSRPWVSGPRLLQILGLGTVIAGALASAATLVVPPASLEATLYAAGMAMVLGLALAFTSAMTELITNWNMANRGEDKRPRARLVPSGNTSLSSLSSMT